MFEVIDAAIYSLLKAFPVTAARLAPRVPLYAYALNPNPSPHPSSPPPLPFESSPLSVKEAVAIQAASGDLRILHAEAAALRQGCVPLKSFNEVSDLELLQGYAAWHSCLGTLLLTLTHTLHDRHISPKDYAQLRFALQDDAARGFELLSRVEALIDAQ